MHQLLGHVVPHFERYPLRGSKARSFTGFVHVCQMIEQGDHLKRSGLETIVRIAYEMNVGKRRYDQSELLMAIDEVKG